MTEFEIAYMTNEYVNTLLTTFINYVSIVFAFLVAAYLVAPRLNTAMSSLVLILCSLTSFYLILAVRYLASRVSVVQSGESPIQGGSDLVPLLDLSLPSQLELMVMVLAYIGSMTFFVQQRKRKVQ